MKFFNKNIKHDRKFIELQTKLNFSYWIASDIDHFYESNKKNINKYEFMKLTKQYQKSLDMFNSVDIEGSNISTEHKSALYALRAFVKSCIEFCDIKNDRFLLDSETFETNILQTIQIEKEFHKIFMSYLHPDEMEAFIIKSYVFFEKGCELLTKLISETELNNQEQIKKLSEKILMNFKHSREALEQALSNTNTFELMLDELSIITKGDLTEADVKDFSNLNTDYIKYWKEHVMAYERYCLNLLNEDEEGGCHLEVLDFEINNYLGFINILAIKLNKFVLSKLDAQIPSLEVYSKRVVKSPVDYIENKRIH